MSGVSSEKLEHRSRDNDDNRGEKEEKTNEALDHLKWVGCPWFLSQITHLWSHNYLSYSQIYVSHDISPSEKEIVDCVELGLQEKITFHRSIVSKFR